MNLWDVRRRAAVRVIASVVVLLTAWVAIPAPAQAQFELLQSLFGPRKAAPRVFEGDAQLDAARQAVERGAIPESLELVRKAMSKGAAQIPFNDDIGLTVSAKLLALIQQWEERHADPETVAALLREIVVPAARPTEVWPYSVPWQPEARPWSPAESRLHRPRSVAAELVKWSMRAQQAGPLRERLQSVLKAENTRPVAEVIAVQLAVAEEDADAANRRLATLRTAVGKSAVVDEWMLHAVTAALEDPATRLAALRLLEAVLDSIGKPDQGLVSECRFDLQLRAVPLYFALEHPDDAVRLALASVNLPISPQRYGAEFAEHIRQMRHSEVATALLNGHRVEEALEVLAARVDTPSSRLEMYYHSFNAAAMLGRELQRLPAEKRYDLLHHWVMPNETRTKLRDLSEYVPGRHSAAVTPEGAPRDSLPAGGILHDLYSTSWHLLATAKELGRMEAVIAELAQLPADDPDAAAVLTLAGVMRDGAAVNPVQIAQTTQRLQSLLETTTANVPKWEDNPKRPLPTLTCVVALEAAQHPSWSTLSQELLLRLIEHSQRLQWDRPRGHLRMAWAEVQRRRQMASNASHAAAESTVTEPDAYREWRGLQPKHWVAAGQETAMQRAGGSMDDVWFTHEEGLEHLTGRYDSSLFFAYPLIGDFQITMDVREGGWSEGGIGYGGVVFATNGYADRAPMHSPGRTNYLQGPPLTNLLNKNPWNRQTLEFKSGTLQCLANGQFVHEDQPGEASPWLCLNADWGRTPIFRNIRLTGTPLIPREVPLLSDHRLRGWFANAYSETREDPLRATPALKRHIVSSNGLAVPVFVTTADQPGDVPTEFVSATDWYWDENELRSPQRAAFFPSPIPSRLTYHRPLLTGETVEYEFFEKSGAVTASPIIGRMIFVIEPKQVVFRPLTDGEAEVGSFPAADVVIPHATGIQENTWNRVRVSMTGDRVQITVNDGAPFGYRFSTAEGREFGFWHDAARTSLRVRNVVLRGDWPKVFTEEHRMAIERPQPVAPPKQRQFLTEIMQEAVVADNAYAVYQRALQLDGEARYEYLRRWVMPGPDHATLRTIGAFTPAHPSSLALADNPIDVATAEARQQLDPRRVQTGGSFVCPAVLLVFSALELGRLGDLSDALDLPQGAADTPAMVRARAAMHGMIALLEDRIDQATAALWECNQRLLDGNSLPQHERWSEPALCSLAILHPATREAAFELLDRIQRRQLQSGQPGIPEFNRYVRFLHGQALFLLQGGDSAEFGVQPRLKQWQAVTQTCARTRGGGYPLGSFDAIGRELSLRGGHDFDMAYFQSPLRGNFEVRMKLTQFDHRELQPLVGGISTVVKYDSKNMKLQSIRSAVQEMPLAAELVPRTRTWGDYRIVVQDGHYTSYVNGQKLYEQNLPPNFDPWIAIQGWAGQSTRIARNVVITGEPEIPPELDLLAPPDLQGWLADYYGTAAGQAPYPWRREDDVLISPQSVLRGAVPGRLKVENVLRYHRPMLEDGVISYEFYYDPDARIAGQVDPQQQRFLAGNPAPVVNWLPGPVVVHPALDRMVCLLEPDGVKLHWLTDGRFDRTGVSPGNVTTIRGAQPLPLKPQEWNAVQFTVTGDELAIALNGEVVFRHAIEPTNQRQFGFFHYVNESTARVRNVRYRGAWPLALPALKDQELAEGPEQLVQIPDAELPARVDYDLTKTAVDVQKFVYVWDARSTRFIQSLPQGARLTFPAGEAKGITIAGFAPRVRVKGDFIATVDYAQLKTTPVKESWGSGLSFKFKMKGSYEAGIEVRRTTTGQSLNCIWKLPTPAGTPVYYAENFSEFPEAGRLRLLRRGANVYFLLAESGSEEFRLLTVRPLGTADLDRVGPQVDCSDAVGGAEVLIKNISIRAQELVPFK